MIFAAVLADIAEMPRSALLPINWEAQEDSRLSALLSRGTSISEGPGEPLELWLILVLADLSVTSCSVACLKKILAPAAHEGAEVVIIAPLLLTRLLGRMPLPLPAS
jgi:hypothetical protein